MWIGTGRGGGRLGGGTIGPTIAMGGFGLMRWNEREGEEEAMKIRRVSDYDFEMTVTIIALVLMFVASLY